MSNWTTALLVCLEILSNTTRPSKSQRELPVFRKAEIHLSPLELQKEYSTIEFSKNNNVELLTG